MRGSQRIRLMSATLRCRVLNVLRGRWWASPLLVRCHAVHVLDWSYSRQTLRNLRKSALERFVGAACMPPNCPVPQPFDPLENVPDCEPLSVLMLNVCSRNGNSRAENFSCPPHFWMRVVLHLSVKQAQSHQRCGVARTPGDPGASPALHNLPQATDMIWEKLGGLCDYEGSNKLSALTGSSLACADCHPSDAWTAALSRTNNLTSAGQGHCNLL